MKLSQEQGTFAFDVSKLIACIFENGYTCTLGEVYRTPTQAKIYAKKGIGIENSLHTKKLAIDINLFSPEGEYLTDSEDYEPFGIFWEKMGKHNRWGGYFVSKYGGRIVDGTHFERNI